MLKVSPSRNISGFSLIELMIGIVILGITVSFGVSSFRVWIQNTQIRTAAESIQNGLQLARSEAVKLNANVNFILATDSGWTVGPVGGAVTQTRSGNEGSKNVTRTVTGGGTTVTYGGLGNIVALGFTQVDLTSSKLTTAESRPLRILVSAMGGVKMCDPNLAVGSSAGACP
jgi:type IV fimbrial biogenesis protein FimT